MHVILSRSSLLLFLFLIGAVAANVLFWFYGRDFQARWTNVPPAPSSLALEASVLGDRQFAYRATGIMLQNFGDTGGRTTPFEDYDYDALADWFYAAEALDPISSYIPFIAGYYFGAVQMPEKIVHVINFLADRAERPGRENWRWLARAVFLARFHEDNPERALMLARRLAGMHESGEAELPIWARQMPVFIMNARGEKETAQALLEETIKSGVGTMHPNEINFLVHFLCTRVLDERQMLVHPFCTDFRNR